MFESLCFFLLLLIANVNAVCQLSARDVSRTNHVFAFQNGNERHLLRSNLLGTGRRLYMLCNSPDGIALTCNPDGSFTPDFPTSNCRIPSRPAVEKVTDNVCKHSLYRVGYRVNNNEFLELYRSCYNETEIQVYYVSYDAYHNTLGRARPVQPFTSDYIISGAAGASFEAKNYYKVFEALLGPHQSYVKSKDELVIDRGHLVPSAGFGFEQYMRMTFKYINAVPQFSKNNKGNWKKIEDWILAVLENRPNGFTICSGVLEVLKLDNKADQPTEVYLYGNNKNPIPKWLFKTVSGDDGEHYAFLTYNNIYDTQKPTPNCIQVQCPLSFNPAHNLGFSFCCDYNDFISRNVPHLINEFIANVSAFCQLSSTDISTTNRIFAIQDNNKRILLRSNLVGTGRLLYLICNSQNVVEITCNVDGTFTPQLPTSDCPNPIKASVERINDNVCPYSLYRVGYKVSNNEFLELYKSCYDQSNIQAHYVYYNAYRNTLADNRPDQAFTTDGVITGAAAASFQAKNIYKRFEELLGPSQSYISSERDLVFDRGHLAPSGGFGFEQDMRATFKYINAVPQFAGINGGNWKRIENWVLTLLNRAPKGYRICTGAFDVLQLPDTTGQMKKVYLYGANGNPVPKWMFKTVSDGEGEYYAFLTYHNIYDTQTPTPNCQQVPCPSSLSFNPAKESSFCCDHNDFIDKNVPHLINKCTF